MTSWLALRGEVWLRTVWELASDAMALSDAHGRVLAANPAYYALYGYTPEEVLGKSFAVIFPPDQRVAAEAQYRDVFRGTEAAPEYHAVVRRRDGGERVVEARASFVEEDGRRVAMLSVVRDVTEAEQARRAAAQIDEERRAFLSSVSHDLKNPLAAIAGHAQLLRRETTRRGAAPPVDRLLAGLGQIEASVRQATRLMDELAEVAAVAAVDEPPLRPAPADLLLLARQAVARHQRLVDDHRLVLEAPAAPLPGHWDASRLERVLDNLLANAIKYSPEGGTIAVRVAPGPRPGAPDAGATAAAATDAEGALIQVQDQGIGIPAADLPHVFDRFRRGRNVGHLHGSGVGLTSVRHIVAQHGGTVGITSREGDGTTVAVWLPVAPPARDPVDPSRPGRPGQSHQLGRPTPPTPEGANT